ncbi:hypothetical protein PENFLA_c061G06661 [Penicillium flavigenum]|uniref:Ketosynthase family 3 (KS3) domain-containing protein n=1 Tax=Penicillium flavigenum TaxID=254877 RepID=A0A1V6SGI0_9EURO|nr:hypothetical protein PENFLA_c061G06661 [Penicillium flavigenum]
MNVDAHYHPDADHGGSVACRGGHFLSENARLFDAPFFSITKNEAIAMDPQGRPLMENVNHAIENADLSIGNVTSEDVSVFVGASNSDFKQILSADDWFFDFKGSSMAVDTACSSSLVVFISAATVSGVNLLDDPDRMYRMSHVGFLSPDSICRSFDHRANGYARGEAVGTLILKSFSDADRDGDTIRAVSEEPGQTRTATPLAWLKLEEIAYVEARGTGTPVGDPIEARAMGAV